MSRKLLKSSLVVSCMTFISRILGLVRDAVFAQILGASLAADVYFFAQKIPNFLRRLFAEGAFSQAFVPILSEYHTQKMQDETRDLIAQVAGTLGGILFLVTLVAVVASPLMVFLFGAGFIDEPDKFELASTLLKITFPYLLFISMTALAGAVLNCYGQFAVPAITPVFLNICLIGSALFIAPSMEEPTYALAWAIFVGGLIQLLFQLPFLYRLRLLVVPKIQRQNKDSGVRRILRLMVPALFGVSVSQINLLIDTQIASFLQTGSISWLYYSDRLLEFPLGLFGIAIATVILPSLSRQHAAQSSNTFSDTLNWALRMVILIGLPAAIGLFLLAQPLLVLLFQYNEFSALDSERAGYSLMAYSCGLLSFMFIKVLAPGYFARQDTKTPVKIGIIAMVANMVFNFILMFPFGHVGLAMATSLSATLNFALLFWGLYKAQVFQIAPGWRVFLIRVLVANACMALCILLLMPDIAVIQAQSFSHRALVVGGLVLAGIFAYAITLLLVGLRARHFVRMTSS